jgi:aminoglycoside phosphotransferase (APT) family kinase protein
MAVPGDLDRLARPDRLGRALADCLGDQAWRTLDVTLISGGKSNLTFELTSPAGSVILRRPPTGELLPSAHDMRREARVQAALAPTPVPVPRIVLNDDAGDLLGVPSYVMEKVPGHVIRDKLPAGYADDPAARRAMADALIGALARLHAVDPESVGLADFGHPQGFLARQLRRWGQQWVASRTAEVPAVDALADRLATRLPESPPPAIVHGDFRLDNCLMSEDDPGVVAAVLDWEMSTVGDPLADLGMLLFYWRTADEDPLRLVPTVTVEPGFPSRAELVDRYAELTGRDVGGIRFYQAFAHFKFAVIMQGVAARVAAGSMAGQDFGDVRELIVRTADNGLAILGERIG